MPIFRRMPFSKFTWGYAVFIVISASFLTQVRAALVARFGDPVVRTSFYSAGLMLGLWLFWAALKRRGLRGLLPALVLLGSAAWMVWKLPYFAEKIHVFSYGLLGFLALQDSSRAGLKGLRFWGSALLFVTAFNLADELFQAVLPYRVGEWRDVWTNALSCGLGFAFFMLLRIRE